MKVIIATVLIFIIMGGVGYIAWSFLGMPGMSMGSGTHTDSGMNSGSGMSSGSRMNMDMSKSNDTNQDQTTAQNQQSAGQDSIKMNMLATQNREKLSEAVDTIHKALELITLDPYAKATEPNTPASSSDTANRDTQFSVIPGGNNIIVINPSSNEKANSVTTTNPSGKYVYDQDKLEQLHNGIYTLSQGVLAIETLSNDLLVQETLVEANPANTETYMVRYNLALQNKTKLQNAISMLSQGITLINVNPYANPNGYQYNADAMEKLHQGIYQMAQGMALLDKLDNDFSQQMVNASMQIQNQPPTMVMNDTGSGFLGMINSSTVIQIVLIVMVIGFIGGILGAINSLFRKPSYPVNQDTSEE